MLPITSGGSSFTVVLPNERAMSRLVVDIAAAIEPGDLVTLSGDLGAGKTTFARALIRHLADDPQMEVPSPTFTLVQSYELPRFAVVHADLYRVTGSSELAELGFDDLPEGAVVLLEWPDRAAAFLPADRLDLTLTLAPQQGPEVRNVRITGYGAVSGRAERLSTVRRFLNDTGFADATRQRLAGDASTRSYERLTLGDRQVILMNAPRRTDGPPIKHGKPYSAIARLAEDVRPFVALATALRDRGFSAPEIYSADLDEGLVILEDLGSHAIVEGDPPTPLEICYELGVDLLVSLHEDVLPETIPISRDAEYRIPHYDVDAFLIEAELLIDWYLPHIGTPAPPAAREAYVALWREALLPVMNEPTTWVLRDFHSPNLFYLPERESIAQIGLLDFQDVLLGPAAYDLASLLQDARVDIPERMELELLSRYAQERQRSARGFDMSSFAKIYATMAAQRASKILGIFARLDRRDGKPQYLRHMPRVWRYLQRSLAHPTLAALSAWYRVHVRPPV